LVAVGGISIEFPQVLGNGKDVAQLAFVGAIPPLLLVALVFLRPLATLACLGSGVPGGLFTPSLAMGALLGGVLGIAWSWFWPGVPPGLFAVIGATAVLAATTHGPISSIVLVMELTARDRSFMLPLLAAVVTATIVARTLDPRSIYDARFTDQEVRNIVRQRRPPAV
jgi:H+/Cl- antiporter ClcA